MKRSRNPNPKPRPRGRDKHLKTAPAKAAHEPPEVPETDPAQALQKVPAMPLGSAALNEGAEDFMPRPKTLDNFCVFWPESKGP